MADPKKVYWDSCCWLGLINDEPGKAERCRFVLKEAVLGAYEIWTSTLSLAEVFKVTAEKEAIKMGVATFPLPPNNDVEFEKFLLQGFLVMVQVDFDIGVDARRLLRAHGVLKKPADGIHLASALQNNVDELHTFDDKNLIPLSGIVTRQDGVALTICYPPEPPTRELMGYPETPA
ncbi:MAG: PIN domain-containing protein [Ramlibacter sp.]